MINVGCWGITASFDLTAVLPVSSGSCWPGSTQTPTQLLDHSPHPKGEEKVEER